jgi:hypothetical protein
MKIMQISYKKVFNLGSYENEQIEMVAELEGDNPNKSLFELREIVHNQHQKMNLLRTKRNCFKILQIRTEKQMEDYNEANCQCGVLCESIYYDLTEIEKYKTFIQKNKEENYEYAKQMLGKYEQSLKEKEQKVTRLKNQIESLEKNI